MTESEKSKNAGNQTVNIEAFNQAVGLLKETAEILGIKHDEGEISIEELRGLPEKARKIKDAGEQISQEHAKFKIFVEESLKENIKHLGDAHVLAGQELSDVEISKDSAKHIKKIVEELKDKRPYLFHEEGFSVSNVPVDFISDGDSGSVLKTLRQKALKSGSPQDLQKYWSARKQVR